MTRHAALSALALLTTLVALPARAQTTGTHWLCGLSQELTRIVCVADTDPRDEVLQPVGASKTTAVVNGTRFPLDPRTHYTVDLWSPPTEGASVELLARATICYRSPGCTVTMNLPAYLQTARR